VIESTVQKKGAKKMLRAQGKRIWYVWVVSVFVLGYFLYWGLPHAAQSQEESTCISCHTSVKELVNITREIAAKNPPQESTESEGEG
jgi:nitrate/TMAO reductase-like tetraheme cytochrome c subunit